MEKQVLCEHPLIIVNPLLRDLILKYRNVTVKGHTTKFNKTYLDFWKLPPCVIPPYKKVVDQDKLWKDGKLSYVREQRIFRDDLKSSFVVDYSTGEHYPVYIEVPCGKCNICKNTKINSFVERCKMETQCYDSLPWFVTLTYDDDHYPITGVSVRHLQLFLKRFRINLSRVGLDYKLRYCACGEYGKNTHRAHYHLIIWGLNCFTPEDFNTVSDVLSSSWDKGFVKHRFVDPGDDKAFYYTAKYLKKDCFVPTYETPDGKILPCNDFFFFSPEDLVV